MTRDPADVSIDEKVAFLAGPAAYPEGGDRIETIETHMSWVFLSDRFAYKLKKPVRTDFLDFSTIAARRRDCAAELALNRRLAARIYLDIVPLTIVDTGGLCLGGNGAVADWLVKMHRLPARRMLDAAIRSGSLRADDIGRFSGVLIDFYRHSTSVGMAPRSYTALFEDAIAARASDLGKAHGVPSAALERVTALQRSFVARRLQILESRAHRVVDGHGDLRPEHICLLDEPVIIDCLEFNRELRLLDPVDELAYLGLECERLGAPGVGDRVFRRYAQATGDRPPPGLIHFYKSFRACLRAQLAIWHTLDGAVRDHDKWRKRACEYLDLAETHAERCMAGIEPRERPES